MINRTNTLEGYQDHRRRFRLGLEELGVAIPLDLSPGDRIDEFAVTTCPICGTNGGGERHDVYHAVDDSDGHMDFETFDHVCRDCYEYIAFGDLNDETAMDLERLAVEAGYADLDDYLSQETES